MIPLRWRVFFVLFLAVEFAIAGLAATETVSASEPAKPVAGPAAAAPTAPAGSQELLKKLKAMDARYRAGFTASGIYFISDARPPQKMRWKITMAGDRMAYEKQVVEILKWKDVLGPGEELPPADEQEGAVFLVSRTVVFFGPEFTGQHSCVGGIPPAGPIAPTPDGERGEIGFCDVMVTAPDAPTFINYTTSGIMHRLGRMFSQYVDRITGIHHREDGMTSITVEGTKARGKPPAERSIEFEIVVDPKADFMVRRYKGTDWNDTILKGLKRNGGLCVPESVEHVGERGRTTILSVSPKPDLGFLKQAEALIRGPNVAPTTVVDKRLKGDNRKEYQPGESWMDE